MQRKIRFTFMTSGVSASAVLLDDVVPRTCDAVWDALPVSGAAHHAVYSGSEAVLILPELVKADPENATADVATGDVGFTWFDAGSSFGVAEAFSELCWFYDADGKPQMMEGPVPVNVFARFEPGSDAFYAASRRIRRAGVQTLLVERVEADITHEVVFRDPGLRVEGLVVERDGARPVVRCHVRANSDVIDAADDLVVAWDGGPWTAAAAAGAPCSNEAGGARVAFDADARAIVLETSTARIVVRVLPSGDAGDVHLIQADEGYLCIYRAFDGAAPDQVDATSAVYAARIRIPKESR